MREVIRRQHKALSTEECYVFWLRRYLTALREMLEGLSSEKKLKQFLTDLPSRRRLGRAKLPAPMMPASRACPIR